MATITKDWSSGSRDKHSASCVGVAGRGLPSAYYRCNGQLVMRQNADGTIDINLTSFYCDQDAISNTNIGTSTWNPNDWTFHGLYISKSAFTLTDGPSGPSGYGAGVQAYSGGTIWHDRTQASTSHYTELRGASSTGWHRIANSIDELEHSEDYTIVYLYAGGLIDFTSTPTDSISIDAVKIAIGGAGSTPEGPGPEIFFEYYPWERKINLTWYSLNREGGKSTTTGLFRKKSGSWSSCTNKQGTSTTDDHGFRYNNGWQKSPKSGLGAL